VVVDPSTRTRRTGAIGRRSRAEFLTWFYDKAMATRNAITDTDVDETLRTFAGREGVLGAMGVYRAAFTSIEQTEPLARHRVTVPVVAVGGRKGLGEKVHGMVKLVASDVESRGRGALPRRRLSCELLSRR
jgi:hypothetical protein